MRQYSCIEPEDRAVDAVVADQQIGAQAQHIDADLFSAQRAAASCNSSTDARLDEPARRAADAIPGVRRQRRVFLDDLFQALQMAMRASALTCSDRSDVSSHLTILCDQTPARFPRRCRRPWSRSNRRLAAVLLQILDDLRRLRQMHGLLAISLDALDQIAALTRCRSASLSRTK